MNIHSAQIDTVDPRDLEVATSHRQCIVLPLWVEMSTLVLRG